jgi:DNA-directed RNA polymerase specialized sigma24 family protein
VEIIDYIQNNLRAYAMKMTEWKYDADDFVQETTLQFLSHDYANLSIQHQKNIAKKIMRNLFRINDLKQVQRRILFYKAYHTQVHTEPVNRIDLQSLQLFLKERNDYHINIFWLYNIGYSIDELVRMFSLKRNTVHGMIRDGKKKLKRLIKGDNITGKREWIRLNWNDRRQKIPFAPI